LEPDLALLVGPDGPDRWQAETDLVLAELARRGTRRDVEVELPHRLSVSQLVDLRRDPERLARRLRRPVPSPPNPQARRGTAFHAWLEQQFGQPALLDVTELPGSADDGSAADDDLPRLQAAFRRSAWSGRTPLEVEAPFELVLDGVVIRGRVDAVYGEEGTSPPRRRGDSVAAQPTLFDEVFDEPEVRDKPDARGVAEAKLEVVDWKTGAPPSGQQATVAAVQLAAYRLAFAHLYRLDLDEVSAAFHYVADDVTVRPADLLDADGLRDLLRSVELRVAQGA
jgi:DNA helicase-2/ATP-dependent DNA helicase PcrA